MIRLARNWREVLKAELTGGPLERIALRSGVVLSGPENAHLAFLFHEIWIDELYRPRGADLNPGDVVVDVGANIGAYAIFAATSAPGVRVYAYEPFPRNVHYLRQNVTESRLGNIEIRAQAVAGESGERTLRVNETDWIFHSLMDRDAKEEGLRVSCVTLDEILAEVGRCDVLKLDCEGSEYEIIYGSGPATLGRVRRIVGEYHEGAGEEGRGAELCRHLERHSFRIDDFTPFDEGGGMFRATNLAPRGAE